jgi:hypothetical protein
MPVLRTNRRPRNRAALFAVAITAGGLIPLVTTATPASASVPGLYRVSVTSEPSSSNKFATARCPHDRKLINAGGYITGGGGKVAMDDKFPDPDLNYVNVLGLETDDYEPDWKVTAVATCAYPLPGLEWKWNESSFTSANPKEATRGCTAGKTMLGTGATIRGGAGEVFVDEITSNGGPGQAATYATVRAVEGDDYLGDWSVNVFVICADPLSGQQVLDETYGRESDDQGGPAECEPDQVATGSAAELLLGEGEVVIDDDFTGTSTTANVWGQENDGTTDSWSIVAHVFCVDS